MPVVQRRQARELASRARIRGRIHLRPTRQGTLSEARTYSRVIKAWIVNTPKGPMLERIEPDTARDSVAWYLGLKPGYGLAGRYLADTWNDVLALEPSGALVERVRQRDGRVRLKLRFQERIAPSYSVQLYAEMQPYYTAEAWRIAKEKVGELFKKINDLSKAESLKPARERRTR